MRLGGLDAEEIALGPSDTADRAILADHLAGTHQLLDLLEDGGCGVLHDYDTRPNVRVPEALVYATTWNSASYVWYHWWLARR